MPRRGHKQCLSSEFSRQHEGDCSVFVIGKVAMGELLREHATLAEQIAETMAERDQLTREMTNGGTSDDANTLLKRIRAFFAID